MAKILDTMGFTETNQLAHLHQRSGGTLVPPQPPPLIAIMLIGKQLKEGDVGERSSPRKVCQKSLHQCQKCGHMFSNKFRLQYHIDHSVCQKKIKITLKNVPVVKDYYNLSTDELIIKLIKTKTKLHTLKEHPQTVKNYILVNFGKENIDEIRENIDEIKEKSPQVLEYIYLLREREFIKTNELIYKIGKTKQIPENRFKGYPKGSEIILVIKVNDCDIAEKHVKILFDNKFVNRTDIGREYYEGNVADMEKELHDICTGEHSSPIAPS
jgi:hypothetical protein